MDLTSNARELLRLVDESPEPVAVSAFSDTIAPVPAGVDEHHRGYTEWAERQLGLYRDSLTLWQEGLVRVVHPANGERPDLVVVTDEGRAALVGSFGQAVELLDAARGPVSLVKETEAAFDDLGASMTFATVTLTRTPRAVPPRETAPDDPWATAGPVRPAAPVDGGEGPSAQPPF